MESKNYFKYCLVFHYFFQFKCSFNYAHRRLSEGKENSVTGHLKVN